MAQRYGGAYSPEGETQNNERVTPQNAFRNRRVAPNFFRANLLFFVPLPLLFSGIGELRAGDAIGMVAEFGSLAILLLAAWLLRDGMKAEIEYNERKIAKPPSIPRKLFANCLTGCGIFLAAWLGWGQSILPAFVIASVASAAHFLSFGIDPMKSKGISDTNAFDAERAAKAIDKAENTLKEMSIAADSFGDRALEARVERLGASVREVLKTVEQDPRDLTRARKFIGVYLTGAKDATVKFSEIYSRDRNTEARTEYVQLIDDLEKSFNDHREVLLLDDRTDLDVEIEVLRDRLQQEGLRAR